MEFLLVFIGEWSLLRNFQSPSVYFGEKVSQVVVPKDLREKVLSLAHCGLLAGHQIKLFTGC